MFSGYCVRHCMGDKNKKNKEKNTVNYVALSCWLLLMSNQGLLMEGCLIIEIKPYCLF